MAAEVFSPGNVITVAFANDSNAYDALTRLKELDAQRQIEIEGAVVVARDANGQIEEMDEIGGAGMVGTASGGVVGLLIGILGGPLGILIGGATGVLVGSLFDSHDADETESALSDISKSVRAGHTALLAQVNEQRPAEASGSAPEQFELLVAHPFNPPHVIPLVEVVPGERTEPGAITNAVAFDEAVGKRPVVVQEVPGFVANRPGRRGLCTRGTARPEAGGAEAAGAGDSPSASVSVMPARTLGLACGDRILRADSVLVSQSGRPGRTLPAVTDQGGDRRFVRKRRVWPGCAGGIAREPVGMQARAAARSAPRRPKKGTSRAFG